MKVLLQLPPIFQPVAMSVFMETHEPYLSRKADNDVQALAESFGVVGISTIFLSDALFNNNSPHVPMEYMRQLDELAVNFTDDVPEIRSRLVSEQKEYCSCLELVEIIINQPKLRLHYDEELVGISPDSTYESYEVNPLFGLLFPHDHFIYVGATSFWSLKAPRSPS